MAEPKRDIQIGPLIARGLQRCWQAREHLLRLGLIPVAVMVVIANPMQDTWNAFRESATANAGEGDPGLMLRMLLLVLCYCATTVLFAVNWLRQLTLGPASATGLGLGLAVRHFRFLFLIIGIGVAVMLVVTILSLALVLLGLGEAGMLTGVSFGFVLLLALFARLSPSWIGIAIDAPMPLSVAWKRTAGQGVKLVLALIVVEIPVLLAGQALAAIFYATGLLEAAPLTFVLTVSVLEICRIALQLAVMASAYPAFMRETV